MYTEWRTISLAKSKDIMPFTSDGVWATYQKKIKLNSSERLKQLWKILFKDIVEGMDLPHILLS